MTSSTPLSLSCPEGGSFFVCAGNATEFVGCCAADPCLDGSGYCSAENLRYSSFAAAQYLAVPKEECVDARYSWYTCAYANPPFLGCCSANACNQKCDAAHLGQAKLGSIAAVRDPFLAPFQTFSTTAQPTVGPSRTGGNAPPTTSATTAGAAGGSTTTSAALGGGPIAGIVIGSVVFILLIASFARVCYTHRRQRRLAAGGPGPGHGPHPNVHQVSPEVGGAAAFDPYRDSYVSSNPTAVPPTPGSYSHFPGSKHSSYSPSGYSVAGSHPHPHQQHHSPVPGGYPPSSPSHAGTDGESVVGGPGRGSYYYQAGGQQQHPYHQAGQQLQPGYQGGYYNNQAPPPAELGITTRPIMELGGESRSELAAGGDVGHHHQPPQQGLGYQAQGQGHQGPPQYQAGG